VSARIAGLYAITPDLADTDDLLYRVRAALAGGARVLQYRNKSADSQLRLTQAPLALAGSPRPRLLGVVMRGLTTESERWRLATVGDWHPTGSHLPQPEVVASLQELCRELFALFSGVVGAGEGRDDRADGEPPQRRVA
jgi:hypothetical protein